MTRISYPQHENGRTDSRYSCRKEYCGYKTPMYVARFTGEFIAARLDIKAAEKAMVDHHAKRSVKP